MSARAIWKGVLQLGGHEVPVKLYSALEDVRVSFRLLNRADSTPVKQVLVDPASGRVVEYADAGRAYRTDGRLVALSEQELESVEPEPSRDISLLAFLPADRVDHHWFERPYWLGPDSDEEAWAALCAALGRTGLVGIAHWVMRRKQYAGALRLHEGRPLLITLRARGEIVELDTADLRDDSNIDAKQLKMAHQLITMLEGEFAHESLTDEYRESVLDLIESKKAGSTVRPRATRKAEPAVDLTAALERSLAEEVRHAA